MLQIWLLYDFHFFVCAYIVAKPYVGTYGTHTRESKDHAVSKFAAFVHAVYDTMCTKFCSKRTTFDKVIVKN